MRLLPILPLCAILAACGMLPRPFQPVEKISMERIAPGLGARAGIVVRRVQGLPAPISAALVDGVVNALRERDMPASAHFANRGSIELTGRIESTAAERLLWALVEPDGSTSLGFGESKPRAAWSEATVLDVAAVAERTAERIVALLEPSPTAGSGAAVAAVAPVVLWAVDGAPGDGGRSLARAMRRSLAGEGIAVAGALDDDTALVLGSVYVTPQGTESTVETVEIAWTVLRPDGTRIGTVTQSNSVPAGRLNGAWGPIADVVAEAGAPGIAALLRRAMAREDPTVIR